MKLKHEKYSFPNYELLEKFTGCKRRDAVALQAYNDLKTLWMNGKSYGISSRRQKRWIHKMRDRGLFTFNIYSGRWRITEKGGKILSEWMDSKKITHDIP